MPWMNAAVDLIHCDVLAGEIGSAETRWREFWEEVLATPAWERWLLGGKMAALRAEMALQTGDPVAAAEWAQRAITMARAVRRAKYESAARALLGKALLAMGRHGDAVRELHAAVKGAEALGNPSGPHAELEDGSGMPKVGMGDHVGRGVVLVEPLRVLPPPDAVIERPRGRVTKRRLRGRHACLGAHPGMSHRNSIVAAPAPNI